MKARIAPDPNSQKRLTYEIARFNALEETKLILKALATLQSNEADIHNILNQRMRDLSAARSIITEALDHYDGDREETYSISVDLILNNKVIFEEELEAKQPSSDENISICSRISSMFFSIINRLRSTPISDQTENEDIFHYDLPNLDRNAIAMGEINNLESTT